MNYLNIESNYSEYCNKDFNLKIKEHITKLYTKLYSKTGSIFRITNLT